MFYVYFHSVLPLFFNWLYTIFIYLLIYETWSLPHCCSFCVVMFLPLAACSPVGEQDPIQQAHLRFMRDGNHTRNAFHTAYSIGIHFKHICSSFVRLRLAIKYHKGVLFKCPRRLIYLICLFPLFLMLRELTYFLKLGNCVHTVLPALP